MDMTHAGSPTGSGNPPGKHSDSYLSGGSMGGNFTGKAGYHAGMDVGMPKSASDVGNHLSATHSTNLHFGKVPPAGALKAFALR